jgi:GMP synthase (glutamine-hydrolysing)
MSNTILVLQQVPHEGLGTLEGAIRRAGADIRLVPTYQTDTPIPDTLDGCSGLIILGGPMSVNNMDDSPALTDQLKLVRQAVAGDLPTLGICLGAQLIAASLDARIFRGDSAEIGWFSVTPSIESAQDPLFAELPSPLPVFQWHSEGFDLPVGAVHLASSPAFPHQAFRLGRHVYGLQFHLEMEAPMIDLWMRENRADLDANAAHVDMADLTKDAEERCALIDPVGRTVAARWLTLAAGR